MANARQKCGVVDLVAVEMEDRQDRAIANGIQKLVDVPGCGEWSGFRFAISDNRRHNQCRIVECRAAGMRQHVTQLPTLMNRSRSLRRTMTPDSSRKRKFF